MLNVTPARFAPGAPVSETASVAVFPASILPSVTSGLPICKLPFGTVTEIAACTFPAVESPLFGTLKPTPITPGLFVRTGFTTSNAATPLAGTTTLVVTAAMLSAAIVIANRNPLLIAPAVARNCGDSRDRHDHADRCRQ